MLQTIVDKLSILSPPFYQILYMSIIGSIVGITVYFVRNIFDKKISGKIKCIMWFIVLAVFLIPLRFEIQTTHTYTNTEIVNKIEDIKNIGNSDFSEENIVQPSVRNHDNSSTDKDHKIAKANSSPPKNISIKELLINAVIPCIWLLGIMICLLTFITAAIKIRTKTSKKTYENERLEQILEDCKVQLHIKKKIKILLQNNQKTPSIFGLISPAILISDEILQQDDLTIKYIFLHELSHYKRKDALFNYVLLVTVSLHWFNPVIWFLFKIIRQDIELGADELASQKLTKHQRKEYGMVLINSLKNFTEENNTTNMLCISDTKKNMKRRLTMLKGKRKNLFIGLLILVIVLGAVTATVFLKNSASNNIEKENQTVSTDQTKTTDENTSVKNQTVDTVLSENEKTKLQNYVNDICNTNLNNRLPEFNNINNADKVWIYSHITRTNDVLSMTEDEIKTDLQKQFGTDLILDVKNDTSAYDNVAMPEYDAAQDKYNLPVFGMDNSVCYVINSIEKTDNQYIVNVIEYNTMSDFDNGGTIVSAYDSSINDNWKWKEVFKTQAVQSEEESKKVDEEIKKTVLERKNEFQSYNITIEKSSNGAFTIKESKMK